MKRQYFICFYYIIYEKLTRANRRGTIESLMLTKTRNFLLFGSFILIILGIGLVSILNRTQSPEESAGDVRARAGVNSALQVNATVVSIHDADSTMVVSDLYFADESRSGEAKNFGTWTVTVPANFNILSVSPGMDVVIGVDSKTFLATAHTLTALTIVPAK
jgi:hypothetical protein